jgi:hypothetical protein
VPAKAKLRHLVVNCINIFEASLGGERLRIGRRAGRCQIAQAVD